VTGAPRFSSILKVGTVRWNREFAVKRPIPDAPGEQVSIRTMPRWSGRFVCWLLLWKGHDVAGHDQVRGDAATADLAGSIRLSSTVKVIVITASHCPDSTMRRSMFRNYQRAVCQATAGVITLIAIAACDTNPRMVEPSISGSRTENVGAPHLPFSGKTLDEMLLAIDSLSPGFGGMYWDTGDTITIVHTRQGALDEAIAAAITVMGDDIPLTHAKGVKLRVAPFDFAQLTKYRSMLQDAVPHSGIVLSDVDEVSNQVFFGVETADAQAQMMLAAAQLKIPDGAVVAKVMARPYKASTLQDRQTTVSGGLMVTFNYGACSLGFNVTYWSSSNYFVTAGHCSPTQGAVDAGWHATQGPCCVNEATEFADPPYTALSGCPTGDICRYSDAAVYLWNTSQTIGLGKISHTATDAYGYGPNTTGITITGQFDITGEAPESWLLPHSQGGPVSNSISKVGATTGWTSEEMVRACFTVGVAGGDLLCQYSAHVFGQPGDSGAPMFYYSGTSATLAGILWGESPSDSTSWFSSITDVQLDLGALKTYPSKP
jgi:hypothetical protein